MSILLVTGLLAIAGAAITATLRALGSDGYARVRTDRLRIPDREPAAASTRDAVRIAGGDYAGSASPR